jgi:predicted RNA-binding Zn-ribbon protein involved in translation (DUF1610 family)
MRWGSLGARNTMLVAGAVILLAAAGYRFWGMRGGGELHERTTWTYFKCPDCGERFPLDAAQIDAALNRMGRSGPQPERALGFPCPRCGGNRAVRDLDGG